MVSKYFGCLTLLVACFIGPLHADPNINIRYFGSAFGVSDELIALLDPQKLSLPGGRTEPYGVTTCADFETIAKFDRFEVGDYLILKQYMEYCAVLKVWAAGGGDIISPDPTKIASLFHGRGFRKYSLAEVKVAGGNNAFETLIKSLYNGDPYSSCISLECRMIRTPTVSDKIDVIYLATVDRKKEHGIADYYELVGRDKHNRIWYWGIIMVEKEDSGMLVSLFNSENARRWDRISKQ